ncbi:uncharacterized protein M421DRAFT_417054 [Didymella exigua CBS 183.55]|uniref:SPT2-domain-containing protein n=1 Tax=Didymella exigua CBS 183.55 TaxID=1150837 RepID=A0A6A5RZ85_9PLEO|nr:uncharacterized protein M421DRAFT_417054 [Didymella exigua CBS 183.55]KAF1932328.1 hypothetical protein M421DRAFT_417054 [Didymella exigua CBS 183.55]
MSAFRDIMSIVGPGGTKTTAAPKQAQSQPTGASRPTPRLAAEINGVTPAPQLKRKASGPTDNGQVKVQRKDSPAQPVQYTGTARSNAPPGAARPGQPATTTVPYRGTAAPSSAKPINALAKKPTVSASTVALPRKATPPAPKPAPATLTSAPAAPASKPKGYLALLQKAKEKDLTKPAAPPVTVAKGLIPTKKERLALKAEATAAKGKKPGIIPTAKGADVKIDASKVQRRAADIGYQGTARPAKTAAPIAYKGTARPQTAAASSSRGGTPAAKPKPKQEKGRYDGYADWSDLDGLEEDEDDYASDASSDMEGGIWDVEKEEREALKFAKKEDAEALAEEMRLKREKEEKKRKLVALSKAAAAKKKY